MTDLTDWTWLMATAPRVLWLAGVSVPLLFMAVAAGAALVGAINA